MNDYWQDWPPMHQLIAKYIGYERKAEKKESTPEELRQLFGGLGGFNVG